MDRAVLNLSLSQLRELALQRFNTKPCSSLVYVVFVVRRRTTVQDQTYSHYWAVRFNLVDLIFEAFDSYVNFARFNEHQLLIEAFLRDVRRDSGVVHPGTLQMGNGTAALWNLIKDLVCLTACRDPAIVRRGDEKEFSSLFLGLGQDGTWFQMTQKKRIAVLCFQLVVVRNPYLIRRLYGKECAKEPGLQTFSFIEALRRATTTKTEIVTTDLPLTSAEATFLLTVQI